MSCTSCDTYLGVMGQPRSYCLGVDGYLDADGYVRVYSVDKNRAIAHATDNRMRNFLVMLAVSEFLAVMEARYAELRDSARAQHRSFTAKGVRLLRKSFLTLSLDLTSVFRDVDSFWQRTWRDRGDTQFVLNHAPWIAAADKAAGRKPFMPIDMVTKCGRSIGTSSRRQSPPTMNIGTSSLRWHLLGHRSMRSGWRG